jgi:spermidine/putrescine-binding protein
MRWNWRPSESLGASSTGGPSSAGWRGAAVAPGLAEAQKPKEIVLVNWGGDALKHCYDAWGKSYETDTDIKVVVDGTGRGEERHVGRVRLRLRHLPRAREADGVPADQKKIYPIDEKRAFDKLKQIKDQTIFWTSGAQSQQLLRDGECSMGCLWNTRATALQRDTNGSVDFTWNLGILCPGVWVVPKGNPAGKAAYDFVRSTQVPERQITLLKAFGNGPANPAASSLVPADLRRIDPGYPDNAKVQLPIYAEWYGDNQGRMLNQFINSPSSAMLAAWHLGFWVNNLVERCPKGVNTLRAVCGRIEPPPVQRRASAGGRGISIRHIILGDPQ